MFLIMAKIESPVNKYIGAYISSYVRPYRGFVKSRYAVNIAGLADFIAADDHDLSYLLCELQKHGFEVTISNGRDSIDGVHVKYLRVVINVLTNLKRFHRPVSSSLSI